MRTKVFSSAVSVLAVAAVPIVLSAQTPVGTAFTYQGQLKDEGRPVNDTCDFEFELYDAASGGSQVGSAVSTNGVDVVNGLFAASVDFGEDCFIGEARWLEVSVQCPGDGDFTTLDPRQPVTPTPHAIYAKSAGFELPIQVTGSFDFPAAVIEATNTSTNGGYAVAGANPEIGTVGYVGGFYGIFGRYGMTTYGWLGGGDYGVYGGNINDNYGGLGSSSQGVYGYSTSGYGGYFQGMGYFSGDVGIGIEVPSEKLEVDGTVKAIAFVGDGSGLTGLAGSTVDLRNVALLRWDLLNSAFRVGSNPLHVAFDGANVWVVNSADHDVTKLRASDAAYLGDFPVGDAPTGAAFDGANVWVVNYLTGDVTKLRASDGANLGTFPVSSDPRYVAFDGTNVWVTNGGGNSVTKLRASDGAHLGDFPVGHEPRGVAFDGANVWVVNWADHNVTKLRASDGANLGDFPVGNWPWGVAFDGANVWVTNSDSDTVTKLRASDGANLGTFPVGNWPRDLAFDGANVWVTNSDSDTVTKLRASDGANLGDFPVGDDPRGVAFDGANVWVVNSQSDTVTRISLVR
ncbi:MAG: hypothetical protein JSV19_01485 [Phycisphaerales bacterium]|nr:MAG: hypothetical protein JSV19_01485 [Phycisphaerales bacterium]